MNAETLLDVQQLSAAIGNVDICSELTLKLNAGSCWGILGINGVGKTTLLHTLAGLHQPTAGRIYCHDKLLNNLGSREKAQRIGVLFQRESLAFPVTVLEAVLAGRHPHLGRWGWETEQDLQIAHAALKQVGMNQHAERISSTLSGGELQRVAIATLLAQTPDIALLDEPSNHLDLGRQINMLQLLKQHFATNGHAMMMVLHDINLALRFCDHLLLLQGNGRWLAGPAKKIATAENLSSLYGHPLALVTGPSGPVLLPE